VKTLVVCFSSTNRCALRDRRSLKAACDIATSHQGDGRSSRATISVTTAGRSAATSTSTTRPAGHGLASCLRVVLLVLGPPDIPDYGRIPSELAYYHDGVTRRSLRTTLPDGGKRSDDEGPAKHAKEEARDVEHCALDKEGDLDCRHNDKKHCAKEDKVGTRAQRCNQPVEYGSDNGGQGSEEAGQCAAGELHDLLVDDLDRRRVGEDMILEEGDCVFGEEALDEAQHPLVVRVHVGHC